MQSSPANALLQGSSDRHQIGRNGSFWLPPKSSFEGKTDFSKDLKEKNQKAHTALPRSSPKANSGKSLASGHSLNETASNFQSSKFKSAANSSPVTKQSKVLSRTQIGNSAVIPGRGSLMHNALESSFRANNINSTVLNTSTSFVVSSRQENYARLKKSSKEGMNCNGFNEEENHSNSGGTKNAFHLAMDLNTYQIPSKFGVNEEEVDENSSQPSIINKLKNFFGDTLLPRISHFCRQGKEVVRFSVDLPNGNPLGVRLQKTDDSYSLCLISPEKKSCDLLTKLSAGLKSIFSSNQTSLKVFHFQSFAEIDDHFSAY